MAKIGDSTVGEVLVVIGVIKAATDLLSQWQETGNLTQEQIHDRLLLELGKSQTSLDNVKSAIERKRIRDAG